MDILITKHLLLFSLINIPYSFIEGVFIWEVGRDKNRKGSFLSGLYNAFFNRNNKKGGKIYVSLLWVWSCLSGFIILAFVVENVDKTTLPNSKSNSNTSSYLNLSIPFMDSKTQISLIICDWMFKNIYKKSSHSESILQSHSVKLLEITWIYCYIGSWILILYRSFNIFSVFEKIVFHTALLGCL